MKDNVRTHSEVHSTHTHMHLMIHLIALKRGLLWPWGFSKQQIHSPCVTRAYRPITLIGAYNIIWFITHRTPGQRVCVCEREKDSKRE